MQFQAKFNIGDIVEVDIHRRQSGTGRFDRKLTAQIIAVTFTPVDGEHYRDFYHIGWQDPMTGTIHGAKDIPSHQLKPLEDDQVAERIREAMNDPATRHAPIRLENASVTIEPPALITFKPDDVAVIRCEGYLPPEKVQCIYEGWNRAFPDEAKRPRLLVLTGGMTLSAVSVDQALASELKRLQFCLDQYGAENDRLRSDALRSDPQLMPEYLIRCSGCGGSHFIDTSIPSDIWNQIATEGEILCAVCIDRRLVDSGLTCEAKFYFGGNGLTSAPYESAPVPATDGDGKAD